MVPENIHTPPWKIIGNCEGERGFKGSNFRGERGVHGTFPEGDEPRAKH